MDNGSRKRKAETPLETERPSPSLYHPRPLRLLRPAELSGIGLSLSPSQPAAATGQINQGDPSPYAGDVVHVYIGRTRADYPTKKRLIELSAPDLPIRADALGYHHVYLTDIHVYLTDIDETIGHILLHFLRTGDYATWPPRHAGAKLTSAEIRDDYTKAVLAYRAAQRYNITLLSLRARHQMFIQGGSLAAVEAMDVFRRYWEGLSGDNFITDEIRRLLGNAFRANERLFEDKRFNDLLGGPPDFDRILGDVMLDLVKGRIDDLSRAEAEAQRAAPAVASQPQPQPPPQCNKPFPVFGMDDLALSGLPFNQKLPPVSHTKHLPVIDFNLRLPQISNTKVLPVIDSNLRLPPIAAWLNALREAEPHELNIHQDEESDRPTDWDSSDSDLCSIMDEDSDTSTVTPKAYIDESDRPTDWDSSDSDLYFIMDEASETTTVTPDTYIDTDIEGPDSDRPTDWDTSDSEMFDFLEDDDSDKSTVTPDTYINESDSDGPTENELEMFDSLKDKDCDTTSTTPNTDIDGSDSDRLTDWDSSDSELYFIMDKVSDTASTSTTPDTEVDGADQEETDYASLALPPSFMDRLDFLLHGDFSTSSNPSYQDCDGEGLESPYYRALDAPPEAMIGFDFLLHEDFETGSVAPDEDIHGDEDADYRSLDGPPGPMPRGFFDCAC
ncbi:hypothetical protein ASPCAL01852 [Aspergillus calidoustus]|uniref:BTB domain-containing protein n=1 Tax=Aspergillus calidoustus TaxID=454130 RepID=A0A0U5GJ24_ASPCI|nr:hypothetical protein ASPCAL01852 [Aspergillus calidoustus]